jgi:hypothetical protein
MTVVHDVLPAVLVAAAVLAWVLWTALRTLIGQEIKGWIPYLARWLVRRGLRHLGPSGAARYREECEADLAELGDRPLTMLWHAFQLHRTTRQLAAIIGREEEPDHDASSADADILVEELGLGVRTYNALKQAGLQTVGGLVSLSEMQLLDASRQIGGELDVRSLDELRKILHARGLSLLQDERE